MENSENKSIISTGSSNLAKTEKLLSITQKILSEIKPKYESVRIGNQEWMTRNLDVDRFRNGDLIPHVELYEEWEEACSNSQPAWCYYDNDPENGKKYGKLYNWFAVNDPRELAPVGWHVPSDDEWTSLDEFLGEDLAGHKMKSDNCWDEWEDKDGEFQNGNGDNASGFNGLPSGYRFTWGNFNFIRNHAFFWSAAEGEVVNGWVRSLSIDESHAGRSSVMESVGASVRCIKDSHDSKWVQAVKNGTIKPYIPPGLKLK